MKHRVSAFLASAILCLAPAALADLSPYSQDFEGLAQADPAALTNDGWLVFGNVFTENFAYIYGYGPFPAPNGGAGFSAIEAGQGDTAQGAQQLSVYSDYNNGDHGNNRFIEANVFQEQTIGNNDVGNTWNFSFDAKRGNIEGSTAALAFFKTLDPNNGFALTNFVTVDMTNVPEDWGQYSLSIFIDPTLVGQILQFGYLSTATGFQGSGVLYDNLIFDLSCEGADDIDPVVSLLNASVVFGAPISMYAETHDDDGYTGGVVAERGYVGDCLILDGATYGDGDGLLTDESIDLDKQELLAIVASCNFTSAPNFVSFEADDCAGNTGVRQVPLSRVSEQPVVQQDAQTGNAATTHFQRR